MPEDASKTDYRKLLRRSWQARRASARGRGRVPGGGEARVLAPRQKKATAQLRPPQRLRRLVYDRFLREIEARGANAFRTAEQTRGAVRRLLQEALATERAPSLTDRERQQVEEEVMSEISGLGPLDPLFADPTISDVLVNGHDDIWVDRFGRLERSEVRFDDDEHLLRLMHRLVASHGRHLDEASPWVDVRLADGSRVHAVIPPLSTAPVLSVRRMRIVPFRLEELCACGTLNPDMAEFLAAAVKSRLNLLISGGAASGKTTILNVLSGFIPPGERVVTIEETAELRLDHPHVVALEGRLPNIEGRGEVTLRTLVRNALRLRPDRIVVGEVRGAEVFDMLQAMNTGHEGSLTTVHANSPSDALRRLENLVLMGGFDLPSRAIRELLGAAFQLIVHTNRFLDGARRVTSLGEVLFENDRLTTREIFRFEHERKGGTERTEGRHVWTGTEPNFMFRFEGSGYRLPASGRDFPTGEEPVGSTHWKDLGEPERVG